MDELIDTKGCNKEHPDSDACCMCDRFLACFSEISEAEQPSEAAKASWEHFKRNYPEYFSDNS